MGVVDRAIREVQRFPSVLGDIPIVGGVLESIGDVVTGALGTSVEGIEGLVTDPLTGFPIALPGITGRFSTSTPARSVVGGFVPPTAVDMTGFSGGNGRFATRTTVETLDTQTGQIVKIKRMPGSPHMMNADIRAAKKVFRQTARLAKRMPRKTVKESKRTQLADAAIDKAIRGVQAEDCPPRKC